MVNRIPLRRFVRQNDRSIDDIEKTYVVFNNHSYYIVHWQFDAHS